MAISETTTTGTSRPALLAALAVFGYFVGRAVVGASVSTSLMAGSGGGPLGEMIGQVWVSTALTVATTWLPFSAVVFLSFWRIGVIHAGLSVAQVLRRGLVASILATAAAFLIEVLTPVILAPSTRSAVSGLFDLQPYVPLDGLALSHLGILISTAPVVLLATVLLWVALRRGPKEVLADAD